MGSNYLRGFNENIGTTDLAIDAIAKCLVTQGPEHTFTHKAQHFILAHAFDGIDSGSFARILFTTNHLYFHATFFASSSAGIKFSVWENPTFTDVSENAITEISRNRASSNTGQASQACHTPGGSGNGTVIAPVLPFGAGGNASQSSPGANRDANEYILRPNTKYLIQAESLANGNSITIGTDYYYRATHKPFISTTTTTSSSSSTTTTT